MNKHDFKSNVSPPQWATRLLTWLADPNTLEEVQGDLLEMYAYWSENDGERKARWRYMLSVLKLLRPFAKQKHANDYSKTYFFSLAMIRNYFKIAFRNLLKNKGYAAINIGGLAIGMAVAVLNGLWIWDELSFNTHHKNYDTIAKVTEQGIREEGKRYSNTSLPYPLSTELKENYAKYFKHILVAQESQEFILDAGEVKLSRRGQFIEEGIAEMLSLKMLKGSWAGMNDPHSIFLSASAAKAIFGDTDPMNKVLKINSSMHARVTGVYEDLPHNTEFYDVKFFAPFTLWTSENPWVVQQQWDNWFLSMYVQMKPGVDFAEVSALIKDVEMNKLKGLEGTKETLARQPQISLLPMSDWHLRGGYNMEDSGPTQIVWLIGLIGAFVLLLACINFMNLSTARSTGRAKEIGIRKAIGSLRGQLISQFFGESFLVISLSFIVTLLLVNVVLPSFNNMVAKQLSFPWASGYFWLAAICFILVTGLVSGSYPAFYLSSFQPVKVLKGAPDLGMSKWGFLGTGSAAATPRKMLVVMQFTVSITLIIGTLMIYRQVQFAKNRPIGYDRSGLLLIEEKTAEFKGKINVLREELKRTGAVDEIAESRSSVAGITMWNGGFSSKGSEIICPNGCGTLPVSTDYGKTIGWQFTSGRDFTRTFAGDSTGIVVNESFAKLTGLKNPVGEFLTWDPQWREPKTYKVLGVVRDMVALSPYEPTIPTVFLLENNYSWLNIRINGNVSASEALPKIEAVFRKHIPSAPFDYKFADLEYAQKFAAEERVGYLALVFTVLAIFISCLGLFGLASFTAEQRSKEIGVRKVLGASVLNLWGMLSKDFVVLVIIAFGISSPLAYYFLSKWLMNYQYRTDLSFWVFVLAGAGALAITLLTVSFQSIKAALTDPVKSLRSE